MYEQEQGQINWINFYCIGLFFLSFFIIILYYALYWKRLKKLLINLKIKAQMTLSKYFLIDKSTSTKLFLPSNPSEIFSIGRTPNNSLQIIDSTVSKNHALIYFIKNQNKFILEDLGSVNGTLINGQLLQSTKIYLKFNDMVQFGKSEDVYYFRQQYPEPEKKGKVNFKDYHFQLEDAVEIRPILGKKNSPGKAQNQTIKDDKFNQDIKSNNNLNSKLTLPLNEKKQKFQRAIKIPKFEQFLQLEGEQQFISPTLQSGQKFTKNIQKNNQILSQQFQPRKWNKNQESNKKNSLKLPELNKNQLTEQDKMLKNILQRKRQLQRAQKQALLKKTQEEQSLTQKRLRLQLQKSLQQQQILQQKYKLQRKAQQSQQNLFKQRQLLEQKFHLHEKQIQQRKQLLEMSLKQKQQKLFQNINKQKQNQLLRLRQREKQLIKQLQTQKNKQIRQFQTKQVQKRQIQQKKFKQQLQNRKNQLQLQANALTRQYENIYKQTIKKMKLNLQQEQQKIYQLQNNIYKTDEENNQLMECLSLESSDLKSLSQEFDQINGRNKAFLMYASHLQEKIDALKMDKMQQKQSNPDHNTKTVIQLRQSILNSRKLLNLKLNQSRALQDNIKESFLSLNVISTSNQDYFNTILQNYQQIHKLKQFYFQFLQQQKSMSNRWDLKLQQNSEIEQKVKSMKKQIEMNKKKLHDNLSENLKKLTQQRVHMLKMLFYVPEQKKNAAKFLVEQMLNLGQENKAIILDSEMVHANITNLILEIEQKKQQNEQLSTILFGGNEYGHHFDNMKQQINNLIQKIDQQRQQDRISLALGSCEQTRNIQNQIFLQIKRQKIIKDDLKNNGHMVPAVNTEKNPLVFFGNLLIKKQNQLSEVQDEEKKLQKVLHQMKMKVNALNQKKNKMGQVMEQFKRQQLKKVRAYLE